MELNERTIDRPTVLELKANRANVLLSSFVSLIYSIHVCLSVFLVKGYESKLYQKKRLTENEI